MWALIVNILLGLWLMVAPGVLDYEKPAANNNHIVAPLILTFAITALWEVNRNARWFNVPAGLWLAASVLFFDYSTAGIVANVGSGLLVAAASLVKGKTEGNYGGGWRSLMQDNPVHWQAVQPNDKRS